MGSIDVDPASNAMAQQTIQASEWYGKETDGLKQDWNGNVFMNPPYGRGLIDEFISMMVQQYQEGNVKQAVVLVDNRTDTAWFHDLCSVASAVAFTKGRIKFYNGDVDVSSPVTGSAFIYLGSNVHRFAAAFDGDCGVFTGPLRMEGK